MQAFTKTQSLVSFLKDNGSQSVSIKHNEETGKHYFRTDNGVSGRIARSIVEAKKIDRTHQISWFQPFDEETGEVTGEASWMLHPSGEDSNATVGEAFTI